MSDEMTNIIVWVEIPTYQLIDSKLRSFALVTGQQNESHVNEA